MSNPNVITADIKYAGTEEHIDVTVNHSEVTPQDQEIDAQRREAASVASRLVMVEGMLVPEDELSRMREDGNLDVGSYEKSH